MPLHLELHVDGAGDVALADLAAAFPTVTVTRVDHAPGALTAAAWRADDLDFWAFDRGVDALVARGEPLRLSVPVEEALAIAGEVLTRAQRAAPRTNPASATPWFARVLARHRARHDLSRPLVQADLDHALDVWQWSLRLDPGAPAAVQLAALLHDVERLVSEADARVEHLAPDYQAFKDAHAAAGARLALDLLAEAGAPAEVAGEAAALIAVHERASDQPALRTINDADALSYFSLNSPGYLAYFGPAQTRKKVAYTLARMSPRARAALAGVRVPREVRAMIAHEAHRA